MGYRYDERTGEVVFDEEPASPENEARARAPLAPPKLGRPQMPVPRQPDLAAHDQAYGRNSGGGGFGSVGRSPNATARFPDQGPPPTGRLPEPASATPDDLNAAMEHNRLLERSAQAQRDQQQYPDLIGAPGRAPIYPENDYSKMGPGPSVGRMPDAPPGNGLPGPPPGDFASLPPAEQERLYALLRGQNQASEPTRAPPNMMPTPQAPYMPSQDMTDLATPEQLAQSLYGRR